MMKKKKKPVLQCAEENHREQEKEEQGDKQIGNPFDVYSRVSLLSLLLCSPCQHPISPSSSSWRIFDIFLQELFIGRGPVYRILFDVSLLFSIKCWMMIDFQTASRHTGNIGRTGPIGFGHGQAERRGTCPQIRFRRGLLQWRIVVVAENQTENLVTLWRALLV